MSDGDWLRSGVDWSTFDADRLTFDGDHGRVPFHPLLVAFALAAGVAVFAVAIVVFPHHSANHDEGVYLQQAAMLLEGKLWTTPPVPDAVRPWFFVRDGPRLYPKYTPVTAAVFAGGLAVGVPRLSLAVVAAGSAALLGLLVREAFDRSTALLAVAFLVASPLFLVTSSVFLSYAPTTLFNLAFALSYVRAIRRQSRRYAAAAGLAVGTAFFARPYTAVLFAAPFVGHALVRLWRARRDDAWLAVVKRLGTVAALGATGVAVTLAYNAVMTGSPLVFPYQAFAPLDGLGFGYHRILGYDRTYTPTLALRANARVVWQFATNWSAVPPLGTVAALVGVAATLTRVGNGDRDGEPLPDGTVQLLLVGVATTVVAGNVYFWGNLNVLAALDDPTDGLVSLLGPFYHFDLLVPFAAFAASGTLVVGRRLYDAANRRWSSTVARRVVLVALVLAVPAAGAVEADAVGTPLEHNDAYTDRYERAYAPFENRTLSDAVVFVPTPYGDWLNHPFQSLRNDPGLDGRRVFVLDRDASGDVAVLNAFPDRTPYRYTYQGEWTTTPADDEPIHPKLVELSVHEGRHHRVTTRVGRVVGAKSATVRLVANGTAVDYGVVNLPRETLTVTWVLNDTRAWVVSEGLKRYGDATSVPVDGPTEVELAVTFVQYGGATVTYRQELTVAPTADGGVRVVWPPETRVCTLTTQCGHEGTYVASAGDYVGGVSVNATIEPSP